MMDDLRSDDGLGDRPGAARSGSHRHSERAPMADREVPLGGQQPEEHQLATTVHAWLDGDLPEATVRRGDTARDVEFWRRINEESERRRSLRTPQHMEAQIMAALPHRAPQLITPWWRREFVVTPAAAVTAVLAVATATAVVTALVVSIAN
jgi:hypothetical protein